MENTYPVSNPQSTNQQPSNFSQLGNPAKDPSDGYKRLIVTVGIIIGLVVIVGVGFLFVRESSNETIIINGTEIARRDVQEISDYYISNGVTDKEQAEEFTKNLYIENSVLKNVLEVNSIQLADLDAEIQSIIDVDSKTRDYPEELSRILAENTVMRSHLLPIIGIKSRSVEIIQLEVPVEQQGNFPSEDYAETMQSKLNLYKQLLDGGISLESVKQRIQADSDLLGKPEIELRIFAIENMTPQMPAFIQQDFIDIVFSTPELSASQIFNVSGKDTITFGIAYVTEAGEGEFNDYAEWLENNKKSVSIEEK